MERTRPKVATEFKIKLGGWSGTLGEEDKTINWEGPGRAGIRTRHGLYSFRVASYVSGVGVKPGRRSAWSADPLAVANGRDISTAPYPDVMGLSACFRCFLICLVVLDVVWTCTGISRFNRGVNNENMEAFASVFK